MNVYFYTHPKQKHEYNIRLIKTLCEHYGVPLVDSPSIADCVWVSCCDPMDFPLIHQARKFGLPIVAGGSVSFMPIMRMWADYVCHGEAYDFIRKFSNVTRLEDIEDFEEVMTDRKPEAVLNEFIDYKLNPIIQCNNTAYYYYCGKGCPQQCQYCALSWSRLWQKAPQILVERAISQIPKKGRLFPMVSFWDYVLPTSMIRRLGILDVKVKNYNATGGYYAGKRVRTGVEFVGEEMRKKLAKPLPQEDINYFVNLTKHNGHEAVLYFIGGLESEEDIITHFMHYPVDMSLLPRLKIVFTYFEPQLITPMGNMNLAERKPIDRDRIYSQLHQVNRRFRFHPMNTLAHSTWRSLLGRVENREQADFYWGLRNEKDNEHLLELVDKHYPHHMGTLTIKELMERPRQARKVKHDGARHSEQETTG